MKNVLILLVFCILMAGCASVNTGGPELITINSTPDQADVSITNEKGENVFQGKTPTTVNLKRELHVVAITKEGYDKHETTLDTVADFQVIGRNLFVGGALALIIDGSNGALMTFEKKQIDAILMKPGEAKVEK